MHSGHPDRILWEPSRHAGQKPNAHAWVTPLTFAWICGSLPLLIGVSTFVLWMATGWSWLELVGIFTILFGTILVLVGFAALTMHEAPGRTVSRARRLVAPFACAIVLLSNFPAAATIVYTVVAIETRYVVEVHNATSEPLDGVRLFGGGCDVALGSILPGDTARSSLRFARDGTLEFECRQGARPVSTTIEEYVTGYASGRADVTVDDQGAVSVARSWRD